MLFQSHVIEVLKNGRSMMVKELMQAIESKGIRAPYNTVYFSLKQLENFNVVSKCVGVNGSACQIGYALKPNYEDGLEEQKSQIGRFQKGNRTRNKTKAKKPSEPQERQKFKQVGEPARQQVWLNELLAKPRVNRIKRGLTV